MEVNTAQQLFLLGSRATTDDFQYIIHSPLGTEGGPFSVLMSEPTEPAHPTSKKWREKCPKGSMSILGTLLR